MAAIKTNTPNLEEILATVNSLPTQTVVQLQEKSVTPSASAQTVTPDSGYTGLSQVNVSGDSNLVASNIISGKTIFGVAGSASTGVNVQVVTGSSTTNSSGNLTVNCGFKPDLVVFHCTTFTESSETYECVISFPINASKTNNGADLSSLAWAGATGGDGYVVEGWVNSITSTGGSFGFYGYTGSWGGSYTKNQTYNLTAVKYTA